MPSFDFVIDVPIKQTVRVAQIAGLYDVTLAEKCSRRIVGAIPIEEKSWNVGLIVGSSGSGKTQIAKHLFPAQYRLVAEQNWGNNSILDDFKSERAIKDIVLMLSSVGFSSPPDWVKPFHVLSTGQAFRVQLARILLETDFAVVDEFSSVVDRTVACVGSEAVANAVRKNGNKLIAVTCHFDVEGWLKPDWVYNTDTHEFKWGSLRRGPIQLAVRQVNSRAWGLFSQHHYLNAKLNPSSWCACAFLSDIPIAFVAVLPMLGFKKVKRAHRLVVMPDYQGIGIGNELMECVADHFVSTGYRFRRTASHPAVTAHCQRSSKWAYAGQPPVVSVGNRHNRVLTGYGYKDAVGRRVVTFKYIGGAAPTATLQTV